MTRMLPTARTQAISSLVASVVVLACVAAPSPALADVEIPLDSAISPQYQAVDVAAVVESATAVDAPEPVAEPVVPEAPAPEPAAPAPEPEYHPETVPQYQAESAPNKSENVAPEAPEPAAPAPAREEPPVEPPRVEPPEIELPEVELPEVELPKVELPEVEPPEDPEPVAAPAPSSPAPAVGNLNLSIRIFSPGDDGPVTQVIQGGGSTTPGPEPAPTTWTWNWNWSGAPGCDSAPSLPSLGMPGWTWNWNWTCDEPAPAGSLPGIEALVGVLPGLPAAAVAELEALPGIDSLPGIAGLPEDVLPNIAGPAPAKPAADAPESRAGRERSGNRDGLFPRGGPGAWARAPQPEGVALLVAPRAQPRPVAERAAKRRAGRDITATRDAIPAPAGQFGTAMAAASAAAAGGAAPGILTTPALLSLSLLAGALIVGLGLPRLEPRAARLERPG
jgi:hypothetical protein